MADDAQRRDLAEKVGYGSAITPPGDLTSPTPADTTASRPRFPFPAKEFEGVMVTGTGDRVGTLLRCHISTCAGDRVD